MPSFKIAIIGAGPGGTLLAALLSSLDSTSSITIFESDTSINSRSQGGTLDLRTNGGLAALKQAGLYSKFLEHARFDGEAIAIADKKFLKYVSRGPSTQANSGGRPEIDRVQLREILVDAVPKEWIRWGHKLRKIEEDSVGPQKQYRLHFDTKVEECFDLVVGADGAWSKVRPLVSDVKPYYAGMCGISYLIRDAQKRHPDLHAMVNRGSLFVYSDGKNISAQQLGDGSLSVAEEALRPEDWKDTIELDDGPATKATLLQAYKDWDSRLTKLIEVADEDTATVRCYYMLPVGHRWKHRPGVTLLGDAAHVMTPFAGVGVNEALQDSLALAHAIIDAERDITGDLSNSIQSYEEQMFKRAAKAQELTWGCVDDMFLTKGAPRTSIASYLTRMVSTEIDSKALQFLARICIEAFYWVFKLIW